MLNKLQNVGNFQKYVLINKMASDCRLVRTRLHNINVLTGKSRNNCKYQSEVNTQNFHANISVTTLSRDMYNKVKERA